MKKIFILLAIILTSCATTEKTIVRVKVPTTSFQEDLINSIVQDFYGGDTLGKTVYLPK
jgi:uncharacterized lipoprotein YajG